MNRRTGLVGLLLANTLSLFGSRMTMIALPWLVLVATDSPGKAGVVAAAELLPYVLACGLGGPLIDRVGGRRISVVTDALSVAAVGAVPLLQHTGNLTFPALTALVTVAGGLRGFGDTAKRGAMFPQVVAASGVDMARAAGLVDGLSRAAGLVGALLAGPLIVWLGGASQVLTVDAATFGACAILIGLLVRVPGRTQPDGRPDAYHTALRAGLTFMRRDTLVLGLAVMLFVTNLLDQAYAAVLVPLWARDMFGSPVGIAIVGASFGAGAVLGNIAFTWLAPRLPRWAPYAFGFIVAGAPRFVVLATGAPAWGIITMGLAGGVAIAAVNPILSTVLYERVPEHLQARVQGVAVAVASAGMPLGALLGGWLGELGARTGLLIAGGVYLLATLAPFVGRFWRDMDLRPAPGTPQPEPATA